MQYELFAKFEKLLTLPLLLLTTVTGFLSALQSGLGVNTGPALSVVVAITGCLSAIVHTLNQHFAFAARAEKSLGLSKSYQNVTSKIEAELNMMKCEVAAAAPAGGAGGMHMPAALSGVAKEGLGALAGKIPGFAALGGAESAAPAGPAASSSAAAGPTMATKTKFMQMIQTEIATLNGSIDDLPAALATVAEVAVGLAAVHSCFGCFKRHAPVGSGVVSDLAADLPTPRALASGAMQDASRLEASFSGSQPPSRATSRSRGEAPSGARREREPRSPRNGKSGEDRKGFDDVL
jgi:hypothetical protein